jgi:hypothetical protein
MASPTPVTPWGGHQVELSFEGGILRLSKEPYAKVLVGHAAERDPLAWEGHSMLCSYDPRRGVQRGKAPLPRVRGTTGTDFNAPSAKALPPLWQRGGQGEFGTQGVEVRYGDSAFLDSRFPASARTGPVFTRTSFAGMTEESVRLRQTGSFGVSPKSFYLPPKIEDPPQEEWGIKGG